MMHEFHSRGVALVPRVFTANECTDILSRASNTARPAAAGSRRLLDLEWCRSIARRLRDRVTLLHSLDYVAVQCTYFQKSRDRNWLVALHQDLSIPVEHRHEIAGFGPWSQKEGEVFVQPPVDLLEQLIAVRVHLDRCSEIDGPLHVLPGSHTHGVLTSNVALEMKKTQGTAPCVADTGDALLMRPLLLHASSKASGTSLRRVLHFLYGPRELPRGLRWRYVA